MSKPRLLVFVVAYEAERHLCSVFERVPRDWLRRDDVHFLCIDDASTDVGVEVLEDWLEDRGIRNVTILKNRSNQGYGGNQKLGYRIAIEAGYDFVILLHGDGQYAPELLTEFERQWRETDADVVLGSRMHSIRSARTGGMPWYKLLGNRFLTWFQNRLTGLALSEYHTGYRGYSTRYLQEIPFELNTNDFHFDTEILLQAANVSARIVEFPIPTHYGDEVCRVNGVRYACDVVRATIGFRMHRMGMRCSLLYRGGLPTTNADQRVLYSAEERAIALAERGGSRRILDVGCGNGDVARACRERFDAHVVGLDGLEPAPGSMEEFHQVELESEPLPVDAFDFDTVLMLGVLERLSEPEQLLLAIRHDSRVDAPPPRCLVTTPNVSFITVRLNLLLGQFNYAERGILNVAHNRLFTRASLLRALKSCGYEVSRVHAIGPPFETVIGGWIGRGFNVIGNLLARAWPSMFAFQFLVECAPRPGVQHVFAVAQRVREDERNPLPEVDRPVQIADGPVGGSGAPLPARPR